MKKKLVYETLGSFVSNKKLNEDAPPEMESWVKENKTKFKQKYGKKWASYLYGTAWKIYNEKHGLDEEELDEEHVNPYDKVGNMMLKKMKVSSYFKKGKNQEVHQRKIK